MNRDKMIEALAREIEVTMNAHRDLDDMSDVIAAAVLDLCGPEPLVWSGNEDDCYMQVTTLSGVYCVGVVNDGWYAEFEAHTAPKPHSLGWYYDSATSAKAAAQSHADAAHWANTPLGKLVGVV
jgi:hypothetical protein